MDQISSLKERSIFSKLKLVWWGLILMLGVLLIFFFGRKIIDSYSTFRILGLILWAGDFLILFGLLRIFRFFKGLVVLIFYTVIHLVILWLMYSFLGDYVLFLASIRFTPPVWVLSLLGWGFLIIDANKQTYHNRKLFNIVMIAMLILPSVILMLLSSFVAHTPR